MPYHNLIQSIRNNTVLEPLILYRVFDSKCTRPETSNLYQSFAILMNTSTGIIVDLNNLHFKWHNDCRRQTVK